MFSRTNHKDVTACSGFNFQDVHARQSELEKGNLNVPQGNSFDKKRELASPKLALKT